MTPEETARDLLDRLNLPDDAREILAHPKYWNAAFCRLYLERCEAIRFEDPKAGLRAVRIAPELAIRVPQHQCRDERGWCSLQLDALGVTGSAYRAVADLDFAEKTFLVATELFADRAGDLACARLMQRMAYLRAAQRRFEEADELVEEAIGVYQRRGERHLLGCALVDRGVIYGRSKRFELAVRDLLEALDLLEEKRDSRYHYSAIHNLTHALLNVESVDPREAMTWLRRAQELNHQPETSLSRVKLLWIEGEALARLGRFREAEEALTLAYHRLLEHGAILDAALAGIELAEICFQEGRTNEVRRLAGELFPLFQALRNDQDAFDALKLFHRAALAETLTAEVFARVKSVLKDRGLAIV